jgi:hypothetical protein
MILFWGRVGSPICINLYSYAILGAKNADNFHGNYADKKKDPAGFPTGSREHKSHKICYLALTRHSLRYVVAIHFGFPKTPAGPEALRDMRAKPSSSVHPSCLSQAYYTRAAAIVNLPSLTFERFSEKAVSVV